MNSLNFFVVCPNDQSSLLEKKLSLRILMTDNDESSKLATDVGNIYISIEQKYKAELKQRLDNLREQNAQGRVLKFLHTGYKYATF